VSRMPRARRLAAVAGRAGRSFLGIILNCKAGGL
jgi:hypothetical protein